MTITLWHEGSEDAIPKGLGTIPRYGRASMSGTRVVAYEFDFKVDKKVIPILEDAGWWDFMDLPIFRLDEGEDVEEGRAKVLARLRWSCRSSLCFSSLARWGFRKHLQFNPFLSMLFIFSHGSSLFLQEDPMDCPTLSLLTTSHLKKSQSCPILLQRR